MVRIPCFRWGKRRRGETAIQQTLDFFLFLSKNLCHPVICYKSILIAGESFNISPPPPLMSLLTNRSKGVDFSEGHSFIRALLKGFATYKEVTGIHRTEKKIKINDSGLQRSSLAHSFSKENKRFAAQ